VYKVLQILLRFGRILAIENLKKHLILALLIFNMTFWLFKTQRKNKKSLVGRQAFSRQDGRCCQGSTHTETPYTCTEAPYDGGHKDTHTRVFLKFYFCSQNDDHPKGRGRKSGDHL
jgi:hypothetical protein